MKKIIGKGKPPRITPGDRAEGITKLHNHAKRHKINTKRKAKR